jgi:integrase/recombinase XerD
MIAENRSSIISQSLFININEGRNQGQPLSYRNYLKILKRCAARVNLDEAKIRTHNGRSTKAMEYLEYQALHPEAGITDVIIAECFGWNSLDSIKHYRDHNNQVIAKSVSEKLHRKAGNNDKID